jgi:hypothetical protein
VGPPPRDRITPATLAVARLAGEDATLIDVFAWAAGLGLDLEPVSQLTGDLHT